MSITYVAIVYLHDGSASGVTFSDMTGFAIGQLELPCKSRGDVPHIAAHIPHSWVDCSAQRKGDFGIKHSNFRSLVIHPKTRSTRSYSSHGHANKIAVLIDEDNEINKTNKTGTATVIPPHMIITRVVHFGRGVVTGEDEGGLRTFGVDIISCIRFSKSANFSRSASDMNSCMRTPSRLSLVLYSAPSPKMDALYNSGNQLLGENAPGKQTLSFYSGRYPIKRGA